MTNLTKTLLTISTLLLVGCSDTPKDTVADMYDALKKGDLSKLIKNSTDHVSGAFSAHALANCSLDKAAYKDDDLKLVNECLKEEYSQINVKEITLTTISENEINAVVVTELNSTEKSSELSLIKVDNKWKVDFRKKQ